jgi:hypothetical protein
MKTKVDGTKAQPPHKLENFWAWWIPILTCYFPPGIILGACRIYESALPGNVDWLIIYCVHEIFTYMELSPLDLCSASNAFEQGGIFIVPHLLWQGASVFSVSSKGSSHSIASYDTQGDTEDLFLPWSSFQSSITIPKGMLITDLMTYILTRIHTDLEMLSLFIYMYISSITRLHGRLVVLYSGLVVLYSGKL